MIGLIFVFLILALLFGGLTFGGFLAGTAALIIGYVAFGIFTFLFLIFLIKKIVSK